MSADNPAAPRPWKAIAAMAENRVIGAGNRLPWNLPDDLKWVKSCTRGHAIAMGRLTYLSMGRPLPGRENIVISRTVDSIEGCTVLPSLDALLCYPTERQIWIFGGAQIYAAALPRVQTLYLTLVRGEFVGDAFFPPFEHAFSMAEIVRKEKDYTIFRYEAKASPDRASRR